MVTFLLIAILSTVTTIFAQGYPTPLAYYVNSAELVANTYKLYWNYTKTNITGEIHVKTNGWAGFGLTPNGGMTGSDVFVAWIDTNGKTNFTDRYITTDRRVLIDQSQDWYLLKSSHMNGVLIIQFSRNIDTCDEYGTDQVIPTGSARVIFAWNDQLPPTNGDISYHGVSNRGSASVRLISSLNQDLKITAEDMIETYAFNVNATIPSIETYYHCHMFKLPQKLIDNKRHLLRTATNITVGNEQHVHHWLFYQCSHSFENEYLKSNSLPLPGHCFDDQFTNSANPPNTWNTVSQYCTQISLIWAIGGELILDFPNGLAYPIGGSDGEFTYFYLEMHYNNPELKSGVRDTSGIQLYVTPNFRKTEIGVFTSGAASSLFGILIPPRQDSYELKYDCHKNCMNNFYGGKSVTIFAVTPHTHLTGIEVYTTLIRNGVEIAYIDKSKYYDFNYQNLNFLTEPIVLQPNDEIRTKCVYRTTNKLNYTLGGIGTPQEMCLDFLFYYPRRPSMGGCLSFPSNEEWGRLINNLAQNGAIQLSKNPPDYQSLIKDIGTLKSDVNTITMIKKFFDTANQTQYCVLNGTLDVSTSPRVNPKPIVENDPCMPILNDAKIVFFEPLITIMILMIYSLLQYY